MSQHDMDIANQAGAAFRSDLNSALAALISNSAGTSEPGTTYAYQFWADTTNSLLKIRNAANNAWVTVGTLGSTNLGLAALGTAQAWTKPQTATPFALTSSTTWDGATYQQLTADVNGAIFTLAAGSAAPANGTYVSLFVKYTTTHALAFTTGSSKSFSGVTAFTGTNTAGKYDHLVFRYDSTADRFMLVGYRLDVGA